MTKRERKLLADIVEDMRKDFNSGNTIERSNGLRDAYCRLCVLLRMFDKED